MSAYWRALSGFRKNLLRPLGNIHANRSDREIRTIPAPVNQDHDASTSQTSATLHGRVPHRTPHARDRNNPTPGTQGQPPSETRGTPTTETTPPRSPRPTAPRRATRSHYTTPPSDRDTPQRASYPGRRLPDPFAPTEPSVTPRPGETGKKHTAWDNFPSARWMRQSNSLPTSRSPCALEFSGVSILCRPRPDSQHTAGQATVARRQACTYKTEEPGRSPQRTPWTLGDLQDLDARRDGGDPRTKLASDPKLEE